MRRHVLAALVIFVLALAEGSLLPAMLGDLPRPNLVLIVASTWAVLRGNEGFLWAGFGGLWLDLTSGAPFGLHLLGLPLGNLVAIVVDQIPNPMPWLRATNWVAVATAVFYAVALGVLAIAQRPFDLAFAVQNVVLPALVINPLLTLPTFALLLRLQRRLRTQESFLALR
ncbi:MAG: rod shape-determining protein MreD [Thermoflexales bacterium]|nr:rod shape-determining protein MreD [Thermoflexales bacterium]MCS7325313.1 rod shape-determining protein MreD [Thermoflexales bacterium]MCX7938744.1 rod shape-determining protein MreD [Thermoflexales bacterium]MDW8053623.1 rod shape-determining protein MreD [Anaerolineae bacterium]MDW8292087.1 rod shape-determining protein MreD [Anaerolineae bacterium]